MAPLANAKHEAFARAIVEGKPARHAYRGAGYKPKSDDVADACASRLLAEAKVGERVAELKERAAEKTVMTRAEVLAELSFLGRANMADMAHVAVSGDVVGDIKGLAREHAAAISEITVESYEEHDPDAKDDDARRTVKRVKFKLHDKRGALSELRRHYEPQKHEHTGKDGAPIETKDVGEKMSDLEVARRIAFLLAKAARETIAGGAEPSAPADPAAADKAKE